MANESRRLDSVCVFCGSSNDADPAFLAAAADLGRVLAAAKVRLVYGGGGVGLMGASARAAHEAGGDVLGVIPQFLVAAERQLDVVETVVVETMHQRKTMMYDASDAYIILPGGIGTLEEVIELLSWRRLALHAKPIVFFNPRGFWQPLFDLLHHTISEKLSPAGFERSWTSVDTVAEILPALEAELRAMPSVVDATHLT
ncbi:uncharacterized protein (TIGR00730 family) [Caulobacter ginsengisoli]|uniref:Cytokinin riboside 5'-monophosphate phosphoribohydrolase n=1 Tax=Caulobacter ginsengisoli TaxID=400775 RepID=A0ABU0IPB9_9CAUL|nr:TIGR00730 family Rossman fold protein [Caulobacter ginsengisoli]MDQ0463851.1 uncharacterized protein (TIGR00730 family) [Caulobacter ginsengisoli]